MADITGQERLHVNLRTRRPWSRRRRRVTLVVAFVLCTPVMIGLERTYPGALDSLLALGFLGGAVYTRKLPVRIGPLPVWAWYLAAAAFFVALAIVDARAG
jgi:hypothetical protein